MNAPVQRPSRGRRILRIGLLAGGAVLVLLTVATFPPVIEFAWRRTRGTRFEGSVVRWHLALYGKPVPKALARGGIGFDQPVEDVEGRYGPFRKTTSGPWTELEEPGNYVLAFEGYRLIARDGRLVAAGWWTCTGSVEFFNTLSPAEWEDCNESLREGRGRKFLESRFPRMAVAGVGSYLEPHPPAPEPLPENPE